ncbi:hypothetical protein [Actinoplanes awajinensis]|uniref:hypothetical protein n=1 Tax=Actinoplanes awajinensis TaxID=135946 RepID=UPI000A4EB79E|nr:hypothetical protein [Actinoplanes awajinensis]
MLRNADFRRLWFGQTASQLGEHTSLVILPLVAVLTLGVGADQLGVLRAVARRRNCCSRCSPGCGWTAGAPVP